MKTKMKKSIRFLTLLVLAANLLTACKKDDNEAKVSVQLTDDPFPIQMVNAANIGVTKIELKDSEGNYVTVFNGNTEVNMVDYTNGATAEVSVNSVPAGTYTEAKISLSSASVELADGRNFSASISGSTGYSVNIYPPVVVEEGDTEDLLIDMDLSDSFGFESSFLGGWIDDIAGITGLSFFSPDFRAVNLSKTGSIEGVITDSNGNTVAYAYVQVAYDYDGDGANETVSTIADANGHYAIIGLPEGSYTVSVETENGSAEVNNVEVTVQHNFAVNVTIN